MWEVRWNAPKEGEPAMSGPHSNSQMMQWAGEGHFAKRGGAAARRVRDGAPASDFNNVERLDFELFE